MMRNPCVVLFFFFFPSTFFILLFSFLLKTNYNHNSFSDETQKWIVMSLYVEDTPGFHFFFFLPFLLPSSFSSSIYGLVESFRVPQTHSFRLLLSWFSECQILPSLSLCKRKIARERERGRKGFASDLDPSCHLFSVTVLTSPSLVLLFRMTCHQLSKIFSIFCT